MFQVYEDSNKQYRWRITAANGKIIGASTESFFNKSDCTSNAGLVRDALVAASK